MAEAIRERRGSPFELSGHPFDSVPISVATYLKLETSSLQSSLEILSAIDEEDISFDIVSLSKFTENDLGESGGRRRKEVDVSSSFVAGSLAAYSQNWWSLIPITGSSSAT